MKQSKNSCIQPFNTAFKHPLQDPTIGHSPVHHVFNMVDHLRLETALTEEEGAKVEHGLSSNFPARVAELVNNSLHCSTLRVLIGIAGDEMHKATHTLHLGFVNCLAYLSKRRVVHNSITTIKQFESNTRTVPSSKINIKLVNIQCVLFLSGLFVLNIPI